MTTERTSFSPFRLASARLGADSHELPAELRLARVEPEEPRERAHGRSRCDGETRFAAVRGVLDELLSSGDDGEPVHVEEREPRPPQVGHLETGVAQRSIEQPGTEVTAMPDVFVERRHRTRWHGDDEAAAGREQG